MSKYNCGVLNCGNGKCIHELTEEKCPYCGFKMVLVKTNGHRFCSNHESICEYEIPNEKKKIDGLKDHQIALLVNSLRESLSHLIPHQCLRELIQQSVVKYLEDNNLRIDKKEN